MTTTQNHNIVESWFQEEYQNLHPTLQQFHNKGGILKGHATITYGKGLAHFIAKRLAKKMHLPNPGNHYLRVEIEPTAKGLIWNRSFNRATTIQSLFIPQGTIHDGYWIEKTGKLQVHLTVDIKQGGWYWRPLRMKYGRLAIPLWLIPQATAYKIIEQEKYKFHVSFALPIIGKILSYSGKLTQLKQPL